MQKCNWKNEIKFRAIKDKWNSNHTSTENYAKYFAAKYCIENLVICAHCVMQVIAIGISINGKEEWLCNLYFSLLAVKFNT